LGWPRARHRRFCSPEHHRALHPLCHDDPGPRGPATGSGHLAHGGPTQQGQRRCLRDSRARRHDPSRGCGKGLVSAPGVGGRLRVLDRTASPPKRPVGARITGLPADQRDAGDALTFQTGRQPNRDTTSGTPPQRPTSRLAGASARDVESARAGRCT